VSVSCGASARAVFLVKRNAAVSGLFSFLASLCISQRKHVAAVGSIPAMHVLLRPVVQMVESAKSLPLGFGEHFFNRSSQLGLLESVLRHQQAGQQFSKEHKVKIIVCPGFRGSGKSHFAQKSMRRLAETDSHWMNTIPIYVDLYALRAFPHAVAISSMTATIAGHYIVAGALLRVLDIDGDVERLHAICLNAKTPVDFSPEANVYPESFVQYLHENRIPGAGHPDQARSLLAHLYGKWQKRNRYLNEVHAIVAGLRTFECSDKIVQSALEIGVIPHTRLFIAFDELHKTCLMGENINPRDTVPYFYDVLTAAALTGVTFFVCSASPSIYQVDTARQLLSGARNLELMSLPAFSLPDMIGIMEVFIGGYAKNVVTRAGELMWLLTGGAPRLTIVCMMNYGRQIADLVQSCATITPAVFHSALSMLGSLVRSCMDLHGDRWAFANDFGADVKNSLLAHALFSIPMDLHMSLDRQSWLAGPYMSVAEALTAINLFAGSAVQSAPGTRLLRAVCAPLLCGSQQEVSNQRGRLAQSPGFPVTLDALREHPQELYIPGSDFQCMSDSASTGDGQRFERTLWWSWLCRVRHCNRFTSSPLQFAEVFPFLQGTACANLPFPSSVASDRDSSWVFPAIRRFPKMSGSGVKVLDFEHLCSWDRLSGLGIDLANMQTRCFGHSGHVMHTGMWACAAKHSNFVARPDDWDVLWDVMEEKVLYVPLPESSSGDAYVRLPGNCVLVWQAKMHSLTTADSVLQADVLAEVRNSIPAHFLCELLSAHDASRVYDRFRGQVRSALAMLHRQSRRRKDNLRAAAVDMIDSVRALRTRLGGNSGVRTAHLLVRVFSRLLECGTLPYTDCEIVLNRLSEDLVRLEVVPHPRFVFVFVFSSKVTGPGWTPIVEDGMLIGHRLQNKVGTVDVDVVVLTAWGARFVVSHCGAEEIFRRMAL
jgi:hypothetical protein